MKCVLVMKQFCSDYDFKIFLVFFMKIICGYIIDILVNNIN